MVKTRWELSFFSIIYIDWVIIYNMNFMNIDVHEY